MSIPSNALLTAVLFAGSLASAAPLTVAKLDRTSTVDFEKEILPIFRANCLACHNQTKAKAELNLETPALIRKGGDSGPAVVPGKAAGSLLFKAAAHLDDPIMPPAGNKSGAKNLSGAELALLKLWIDQGAKGEVKGFVEIHWQPIAGNLNPVYSVALSPDGQYAACNRANKIHVYHLPTGTLVAELTDPAIGKDARYAGQKVAHHDLAYALAFSPDGMTLASGSFQEIKFWQRSTPAAKPVSAPSATRLIASHDGGRFASVDTGVIRVFDAANGREIRSFTSADGTFGDAKLSTDGNQLAAGDAALLRVWGVSDGGVVAVLTNAVDIAAVAFFGGDTQVAAGGRDKIIRTWKLPAKAGEAATPGKDLTGHTADITSLSSDETGKLLVSGGADRMVRTWDPAAAKALQTMNHGAPVIGAVASPDGKAVASLGKDTVGAKLWNAATGKLITDLKGNFRLDEMAEEKSRYYTFEKGEVTYWKGAVKKAQDDKKKADDAKKKADDEAAKLAKDFPAKEKALKTAQDEKAAADKALAAAETALPKAEAAKTAAAEAAQKAADAAKTAQAEVGKAKAKAEDKAKAEEAAKAAAAKSKTAEEQKSQADKVAADATKAVADAKKKRDDAEKKVTDAEKPVAEYRTAQDIAKRSIRDVERAVAALADAEKEQKAAEAAEALAKKEADDSKAVAQKSAQPFTAVSFTADSRRLATLGADGAVAVWNTADGRGLNRPADTGKVGALTFAGTQLVTVINQMAVKEITPEWKLVRTIGTCTGASPLIGRVTSLAFSPDGSMLASGSGDPSRSGQLILWQTADGRKVNEIYNAHSDVVQGLSFSRDGKWLASGSADKFAKVWNVAGGKQLHSFEGHTHQVMDVDLNRDSRTLVSAGADGVIKVWDLVTGEARRTIKGYNKEITSIAFVGYENRFVIATGESIVRYLNDSGGTLRSFAGASDFVYAARASRDGKLVLAGGQDGVLRVWDGDKGTLLKSYEPPAGPQAVAQAAKK